MLSKDSCQVRRTGSCKWNNQICSMQSLLSLCKFYQAFIDTVGYIFSYTDEIQHSMENSEQFQCALSLKVHFFRHLFLVLEFWLTFYSCHRWFFVVVGANMWKELVLKQPRRLTDWDPLCCCYAVHLIYPHLTGNSNTRGAKWQTHLWQYLCFLMIPLAGFSMVVLAVQIKLQEIMQVH